MTLALYGKSRARRAVLVAAATAAVVGGVVVGLGVRDSEEVRADQSAYQEGGVVQGDCNAPTTAQFDDGNRATCTNGQSLTQAGFALNTLVPAGATNLGFTVRVNGGVNGSGGAADKLDVQLSWDNGSSLTAATPIAFLSPPDTDEFAPSDESCSNFGRTWTIAELSNFRILATADTDDTLAIDDIDVRVCWTPPSGSIVVQKVVTNVGGDATLFDASIDGGSSFTFSETTPSASQTASAGARVVTEAAEANYTTIGWAVGANGTCPATPTGTTATTGVDNTAEVSVTASTTTYVCFYNELQPTNPNLTLTKTDTPDPVTENTNITYTIDVGNDGNAATSGTITVTDNTPANTTFVSVTLNGWSCVTPSVGGTGAITCNYTAAIPAGGTGPDLTIVVKVNDNFCGTISNTATVSGGGDTGTDPDATANASTTSEGCVANPAVSKSVTGGTSSVAINTQFSYTVVVSNNGNAPASNVTLTDTLSNATLVSVTDNDAGTSYNCEGTPGSLSCNLGQLDIAESITFTITVQANGTCLPVDNSVTVANIGTGGNSSTSDDTDNSGNQVTVTGCTFDVDGDKEQDTSNSDGVYFTADIAITTTDTIYYRLTVSNAGNQTLTWVSISDDRPAGTSNATEVSDPGSFCTVADANTPDVSCLIPSLGPGSEYEMIYSVTVDDSPVCDFSVVNTASVDSSETSSENTNTVTANGPACVANPEVTKTPSTSSVAFGATFTYTVTVENSGNGTATGVSLTDSLSNGTITAISDGTVTAYNCETTFTPTSFTCSIGTLGPGVSVTFTVSVTANNLCALVNNTATVSSTGGGNSNTDDNTDAADNEVEVTGCLANPNVSKDLTSSSTVGIGGTVTYTIVVNNHGNAVATGVVLNDTLSGGTLTDIDSPTGAFACETSNSFPCNIGTLPAGASHTFNLTVTANSTCAPVTNSATVTSTGTNSNTGDDSSAAPNVTVTGCDANISGTKSQRAGSSGAFTTANITVQGGGTLEYSITATNAGNVTLTGVLISDGAPAGTSGMVLVSAPGGFCQVVGGGLVCTGITLAPGASYTAVVRVTVDPGCSFSLSNNASVSSDQTSEENTNTVTAVGQACVGATNTPTTTPTGTLTPTNTPTNTATPSNTPTGTLTPTNTPTRTTVPTQVVGVITPGVTPAPPATGTGLPAGGDFVNLGLGLLGLAIISGGLVLVAVGRRGRH